MAIFAPSLFVVALWRVRNRVSGRTRFSDSENDFDLHEDDLVGHVLKREGWEVLSFPAIAETDEIHVVETPFGGKEFSRPAGEALHPDRESLETLAEIRATVGEYNFAGQHQQTPAPAGGGMIKEAWFRRYRRGECPEKFDQIIQSWDTANKPSELADLRVRTSTSSMCCARSCRFPTSSAPSSNRIDCSIRSLF